MIPSDYYWNDFLNPVVVREARQGVRERLFIMALYGLLVVEGFLVIYQCLVQKSIATSNHLFHSFIYYLFIVGIPLRAFFSSNIIHEIKERTFEDLALSCLDLRKILYGKWISQLSQAFLIVLLLFPIIIIQYWMGGNEISTNLSQLFTASCLSALFTSIGLVLSSIRFIILRYLLVLLLGFSAYITTHVLIEDDPYNDPFHDSLIPTLFLAFLWSYVLCEMLTPYISLADAAPFRRRILPLSFFAITWSYYLYETSGTHIIPAYCIMVVFLLLEPLQPSGTANLSRFYLVRCFFAQNSLSALIYLLFSLAVVQAGLFLQLYISHPSHQIDDSILHRLLLLYLGEIGIVLTPLIVIDLLFKRFSYRALVVIVFNSLFWITIAFIKDKLTDNSNIYLLEILPSSTFPLLDTIRDNNNLNKSIFGALLSDYIAFMVLALTSLWRMYYVRK